MDGAPSGQAEQFPLTSETILLERLGNRTEDLCITQVDRLTLSGTAVTPGARACLSVPPRAPRCFVEVNCLWPMVRRKAVIERYAALR
eukprot:172399-Prymnesium_polylepis.1